MQDRLLIRTPADVSVSRIDPKSAQRLPRRRRVLLADPSHFRIEYAINPHMRTADGQLQTIQPAVATRQWQALRDAYTAVGCKVEVIPADPKFPDLVFAANQAFPYPDPHSESDAGKYCFIPSRMAHAERAGEVPIVAEWLKKQGYRETPIQNGGKATFEGTGDMTWFGDRRILVGGITKRSNLEGLRSVADLVDAPLVALEMDDPEFFHLDTALTFLDDRTAMWVPQAFRQQSQKTLRALVENLVDVDDLEARRGLACNAHSPDGKAVLIHRGNPRTIHTLTGMGYDVVELDTSEFNKSGGSVFCLKMMLW